MKMRAAGWALLTAALLFAPAAWPVPNPKVSLPLAEYLKMVAAAEAQTKAAEERGRKRETPIAEVVAEHVSVELAETEAKLASQFEVLVQGSPIAALWLPLAGYGAGATIERQNAGGAYGPAPEAALGLPSGRPGALFLTTSAGRYRIKTESRLAVDPDAGQIGLRLLEVAAPVASADFDLPADLEWSSQGAVVVSEEVVPGRRRLHLATQRGQAPQVVVKRRFAQGDATALAHTVLLTLVQLRPEGLRRHDVVLYEVSRGQLAAFEVQLPDGLEVEKAATDEGLAVPIRIGNTLRVERKRQLQGTGYLVLSSTPALTEELPYNPLAPEMEVRARFLAVSASLAAEIAPLPAASFSQVDLTDLPPLLREALGAIDLAAAWRLQEDPAAGPVSGLRLKLAQLPAATTFATTVTQRDTITLLTVDGTLLHRDTFQLAPSERPASSFEVSLPPGAILWSTKVDGQPTRPLERGGRLLVPILPGPGAGTTIEVVAVQERAIPPGRSQLGIELTRVVAPVLEHQWRVLLPDGPKYRFAAGELAPVPMVAPPTYPEPSRPKKAPLGDRLIALKKDDLARPAASPPPPPPAGFADSTYSIDEMPSDADSYVAQVNELQQGLVGGVKPLPITIPETGKALRLTGILPPERITVTIDVKAKK